MSDASNMTPAHRLACYRLYRHVAAWLLAQQETYIVTHVSEVIWSKRVDQITNARHWWRLACEAWAGLGLRHDGQSGNCLCPSCTERQFPLLTQEKAT